MASVSQFLTNKLRLKVNEAKSAVARPEERKFLGWQETTTLVSKVNRTLRGWADYFAVGVA